MTFLTISDTRESLLPEVLANLPGIISMISAGATGGPSAMMPRVVGMPNVRAGRPGAAPLLTIDPELVPSPDDLRPFLFPSWYAMSVDDQGLSFVTRESFPSINPVAALPIVAALGLPAVAASRSAAQRAQSVNNLKIIGLAIHNTVSSTNTIPGPIRDKDGKPLLSWRVAILPFVEQQGLFNEFHLDEPWDSPHNKALIERMPTVYTVPGTAAEPGMTFYRGFDGKGAVFQVANKKGLGIADITDGTSNTIAVVEAKEAVPWTKPDSDLPFNPDMTPEDVRRTILDALGGHSPGGFNALILDGSVRFIKQSVNPVVLKALITFNGGEVISLDAF